MKILLVDDNNDKIALVVDALLTSPSVSRDDIHIAQTIADARRELMGRSFDLLILDILVPQRPGDAPSRAGTQALLEEITERSTLKKPGHIVGLTAYDDALKAAGPEFVKRTWTVIRFAADTPEWRTQLAACVAYIDARRGEIPTREYATDLCVVTALPSPEYAAIERLPWAWQASEPLDDNTFARRGSFQSGGTTYKVVAATATKVGMVPTALLTAKLIEKERPRFLVMAGICAGIRGKANLGDVVFGDPVWDWQSGKHLVGPSGQYFAIAPDPHPLSSFLRARASQFRQDTALLEQIRSAWPSPPTHSLRALLAPMATGAAVIADQDVVDIITEQNRNVAAVDMEAFGAISAAVAAAHPRPSALSVKSVCDFADPSKNDDWQAYAAFTSAQAIRAFFEKYMCEVHSLAGTR